MVVDGDTVGQRHAQQHSDAAADGDTHADADGKLDADGERHGDHHGVLFCRCKRHCRGHRDRVALRRTHAKQHGDADGRRVRVRHRDGNGDALKWRVDVSQRIRSSHTHVNVESDAGRDSVGLVQCHGISLVWRVSVDLVRTDACHHAVCERVASVRLAFAELVSGRHVLAELRHERLCEPAGESRRECQRGSFAEHGQRRRRRFIVVLAARARRDHAVRHTRCGRGNCRWWQQRRARRSRRRWRRCPRRRRRSTYPLLASQPARQADELDGAARHCPGGRGQRPRRLCLL